MNLKDYWPAVFDIAPVRFGQRTCEHAMVKADGSCRFCNAPRAEVLSAIARRVAEASG